MNIVFLCGSLEPGRDGVGDYVHRLAAELLLQGHRVGGVSLNDQYVAQETQQHYPVAEQALAVLRLPSVWTADQRFGRAQQWLNDFAAEWLSLQFVPFSFHPKGLSVNLAKQLARLGLGRRWHVMIHELWVGMEQEATLKHLWWGRLQKHLVRQLLLRLEPQVIHTQTRLYQAQLAKLGFDSTLLPLFTNIPEITRAKESLRVLNSSASAVKPVSLVLFGSIHPGAPVAEFAQDAAQYARQHAVPVTLAMVGRNTGSEQQRWTTAWQNAGLPVRVLGEQSPERVSEVLREASLGIATTPVAQIEKSGTAAAMQEHGLLVLCVARPWTPRGIPALEVPAGIFVYRPGKFAEYLTGAVPVTTTSVQDIARQFSQTLAEYRI